jgi:NADH:quinone reductase (non-electrogenic)
MRDSVAIGRMINEGGRVGWRGTERATPRGQGHAAGPAHIVIVGGGFGGLYTARALARHPVRITVLDRQNYHLFQPLLYEVATAGLSPGDIAQPIRAILRKHRNVRVLLAEAQAVDLDARALRLADGSVLPYDYLVVATGASHSYFGHPEWEGIAPGLKTLDDALEIRRRVLLAFEAAEREDDPADRQALLTFVIVGGGPTGVELAGAIAEIAQHTVRFDFRAIDPRQARVILLEGGPRILAAYPADLSARAAEQLRGLGVEVRENAAVTQVLPRGVHIGDEVITARTVLWAAGVKASPIGGTFEAPRDRTGRVLVEADLTVPGHADAYVVGDLAVFAHHRGRPGSPLPGTAPVAIQMGEHAARNIWRSITGQARTTFHYVDRGSMATIGRAAGIAQIGRVHLWGLPAWLAWLCVHIVFLIGFENRMLVLIQWMWSYFTYQRGARLITATPLSTRWTGHVGDEAGAPRP